MKLMRQKRIHRVAVGDDKKLTDVVTQSDIVRFFARNLNVIDNRSMADLRLVRPVVSVMLDTTAAEAFRTLYDHRVSGIALLDEAGRVTANIRRDAVFHFLNCLKFLFLALLICAALRRRRLASWIGPFSRFCLARDSWRQFAACLNRPCCTM